MSFAKWQDFLKVPNRTSMGQDWAIMEETTSFWIKSDAREVNKMYLIAPMVGLEMKIALLKNGLELLVKCKWMYLCIRTFRIHNKVCTYEVAQGKADKFRVQTTKRVGLTPQK